MYINIRKEVTSIPFDKISLAYEKAVDELEGSIDSKLMESYTSRLNDKIEEEYSSREDSFEGDNEEDILAYNAHRAKAVAKEKLSIRKEIVSTFCNNHNIPSNSSWVMPQIASIVAGMPLTRTAEGKIDTLSYLKGFGRDDWHKGLWMFCTHNLRGDMLKKQYIPDNRNYSALVPLLLMPHKRFNNVKYSEWDTKGLNLAVDTNMYQAMTYGHKFDYSREEILELQKHGLEIRSGTKAGGYRNAQSTHKLYGFTGELHNMPWLAQVMYFQIWCAHPINRGELMILDWDDWDAMPEPLVDLNIIVPLDHSVERTKYVKKVVDEDLPW